MSAIHLRRRKAVLVAGSLATLLCVAAPLGVGASAQSLKETLAKAYTTNPTLLSGRARLRATDEGVAQALSGWRPTVSVSVDAASGQFYTNSASINRDTVRNSSTKGLTLTQNVYRGGRTVNTTNRAENLVKAERARLVSSEQDVLAAAGTAYMDVVRDQAVLDLNRNNERVLQRQLEATRDRFQVGEVTRTDVAQAESRLQRAISDRIKAEGDLIKSRASYRNAVGDMPGTLKSVPPLADLPASEQESLTLARNQNPAVIAARFDERAAADQVRIVAGELLPTVDLEGTVERRDGTSFRGSRADEASVTATLKVPLYQAGSVSSRVREAKETVSQRRKDLERAVRSSMQSATQTWEALQTARSQIRAFSAEVRASEVALEGVRQEAQVGSRTVLDVLDAEQELLNARVNLVTATRDEVVASFNLRSAVGTLTVDRLALNVDRYDVDAHYKSVRGKWYGTSIDGK